MPKNADGTWDNSNSGVIFINKEKEEMLAKDPNNVKVQGWPDRKGSLNVDGVEYWVSGWIKKAKKDGSLFLSLSVTRKEDEQNQDRGEKASQDQRNGESEPF